MTDTDPKSEALYRRLLMERSPAERWLMGAGMCEAARATVLASLPKGQSSVERKIAILRRYYGSELDSDELSRVEQSLRRVASAST